MLIQKWKEGDQPWHQLAGNRWTWSTRSQAQPKSQLQNRKYPSQYSRSPCLFNPITQQISKFTSLSQFYNGKLKGENKIDIRSENAKDKKSMKFQFPSTQYWSEGSTHNKENEKSVTEDKNCLHLWQLFILMGIPNP